ncbi:helix-turn-helix domain-containing protein [Rhodoferax sp. BLA1]|uniref:helix-turn-helix domain-containing protein n=1 Tax=Rhodoferax sp. BLA1 TaxID=2576062 RepID=UPI0015D115AA|nr:helix-turn-helix transcriptional regulator [Rhodoferax sp. BLA1]
MNDAHNHNNIAMAIKTARRTKGMSQEDFSLVSSRTYLSTLERGLKSPTLNKLDELATALGIHPLTLLTMAYLNNNLPASIAALLSKVEAELTVLRREKPD